MIGGTSTEANVWLRYVAFVTAGVRFSMVAPGESVENSELQIQYRQSRQRSQALNKLNILMAGLIERRRRR